MIKLIDLLNEIDIPKNKWTTIPSSELKDYDDEIFNLISTAYAPIGGHPNYKSPDTITGREADAEYEVIDLDDDPEIDAISVTKSKPSGRKFTATGHDNSRPAKSKVVNHKADLLKSNGYFIEVSGKLVDILLAKGVKPVDDEDVVRKVLKGKDIEWLGNGQYKREIGGKLFTKILMGKPTV
tara:strand:+ start:1455 stop:2000 length:546 start_codon:yes stop_codon:yes gene_type:complete